MGGPPFKLISHIHHLDLECTSLHALCYRLLVTLISASKVVTSAEQDHLVPFECMPRGRDLMLPGASIAEYIQHEWAVRGRACVLGFRIV